MSTQLRCTCRRCIIRGLMGPAVITSLGVLFLLGELRDGALSFGHTYPLLFIVIGGILLASALAPMDGHVLDQPAQPPVGLVPPVPPPTVSNPYPGQGQ